MSKANWPENLIEELAYRRTVIFLGSGISATAKNEEGKSPYTWGEFLEMSKALLNNPAESDMQFINDRIEKEDYLLALQAIYKLSDKGVYTKFLKDNYTRGGYKPSASHKAIKEIDSRILITTNFDKIYDNLCNEETYVTHNYNDSSSIITAIKSPENLIIKAHGTIDAPSNIIFTSQQYFEIQQNHPEFYSLLQALFLTHTVLFLGYSMHDPDITLVMQSIKNITGQGSPHYILIKEGASNHLIEHWEYQYNISAITYGPSYDNFEENIIDLKNKVVGLREERGMP